MKKKTQEKKFLYTNNTTEKRSLLTFLNLDHIFLKLFTKTRKKHLTRVAIFFTKLGNGQLWLIFACMTFIYDIPIGITFQFAILIQLYIQILLKNIIKRARPYQKFLDLEALYIPPDPYSFPSGHTCAAFTMAFTAKLAFPILWPYFLVVALIIAFSRIYLAAHYPSDVFAGIIIASFSVRIALICSNLVTGVML
ncbi:MAG: phosphatase PAP2 family protein [Spirochaetota bacterium]|nr:phosphatase PAP2 family protein [Spirochaetota bacterium]